MKKYHYENHKQENSDFSKLNDIKNNFKFFLSSNHHLNNQSPHQKPSPEFTIISGFIKNSDTTFIKEKNNFSNKPSTTIENEPKILEAKIISDEDFIEIEQKKKEVNFRADLFGELLKNQRNERHRKCFDLNYRKNNKIQNKVYFDDSLKNSKNNRKNEENNDDIENSKNVENINLYNPFINKTNNNYLKENCYYPYYFTLTSNFNILYNKNFKNKDNNISCIDDGIINEKTNIFYNESKKPEKDNIITEEIILPINNDNSNNKDNKKNKNFFLNLFRRNNRREKKNNKEDKMEVEDSNLPFDQINNNEIKSTINEFSNKKSILKPKIDFSLQ